MEYLSQILGRPVLDGDGERAGSVSDVIVTANDPLPLAAAFQVRTEDGFFFLPYDALHAADGRAYRVAGPLTAVAAYAAKPHDFWLARDILDKQIVDVHDYRVVRVNDVRLADCGDNILCLIGADASFRAIARRLGIGGPIEAAARLIHRPLSSELIAWDDVETLDPGHAGGGRIRLKVPHEKIARLHPADIADIVEQLSPQQRAEVIEALDVET